MRNLLNWRNILLVLTGFIIIGSFVYFNFLVRNLANVERSRVQTIIKGMENISNAPTNADITFASYIVTNDTTIPIIVTDSLGKVQEYLNLDTTKIKADPEYLNGQLEKFKHLHQAVVSDFYFGKNYIYYGESKLLAKLRVFPIIQLSVIALMILVLTMAIYTNQKRIQNQVWVGLAKETAHQLGTPLSSMVGWMEFLKENEDAKEYVDEMEKDVSRLQLIADRFSKIGSEPQLSTENLVFRLQNMVKYMQLRSPKNVEITFQNKSGSDDIELLLNGPLFDWVIENLIRNALDAMQGKGAISVTLINELTDVIVEVSDTGKGIPKKNFKKVFYPGFSTKKRGWGLGLSLAKRIVEQYHKGRIFVKSSDAKNGTTFRIILNR